MTAAVRVHRTRSREFDANPFRAPRIVFDRAGTGAAVDALLVRLAAKDPATSEHSKRVSRLAAVMGTELGLPSHISCELAWAAALHDIGKLAVPAFLLRKTDRLSAAEYALVGRHMAAGANILAEAFPTHPMFVAVARSHHERADGTGLPDGLARRDIPLAARIVCVADAFDAMITNRPYQQRRALSDAIEELHRCAGRQFDAACVAALTRIVGRITSRVEIGLHIPNTVLA